MEEVVGMTPPCDELEDDIPVWGLEPNGCYSVRSGYLLSIGLEDYNGMSIWKRIWRWEGPEASIHWEGAPEPFATINTDGSVDQRTGRAAAGGSIRNCQGRIVEAFALNLGKCSITRAELAGVIEGMERAWQGGFRHIEVQIDSLCAVKLLSQTDGLNHQHAGIVGKFRALIKRNWVVRNQAYL
ncbi:Putative ribonuclease H protein At1g65750 [Linum perenne]